MSAIGSSLPHAVAARSRPALRELFVESLLLGAVGFGGGLSVLSLIQSRAVEKKGWLTEREFNNAATLAQMLPGGAAANALAYIGLRFHGNRGAAVAYAGFCLPGFVVTLGLAWAYVRFGSLPNADAVLDGLNAAIVGIIAAITLRMVRTAVSRLWQMGVAAAALLLSLVGDASAGEVAFLGIAAGLVLDLLMKHARARTFMKRARPSPHPALPEEGDPLPYTREKTGLFALGGMAGLHVSGADRGIVKLTILFFRTGLGAFGGGFAIIPHLRSTLLSHGWLTAHQFTDAVAIGKLTPGPVLLMATFIGYVVGGFPAAILATIAIFAGPFLLVITLSAWLTRVRSRRPIRAALRGLTPAVVGMMAASAITLGTSLRSTTDVAIAAAVTLTLVRFPVNPVLVLGIVGVARVVMRLTGL